MRPKAVLLAAISGCLAMCLVLAAVLPERDAGASTQRCNTECQTKMTDCVLACDGVLACELACKAKAVACVDACTSEMSRTADEASTPLDATTSEGSTDAARDAKARPDAARESGADAGRALRDAGRPAQHD